jgi:putative membrane protein
MIRPLLSAVLLVPAAAFAHDGQLQATEPWVLEPANTVPLLVSALLYGGGVARLWTEAGPGRGVRAWQIACFGAGWLSVALALVLPLHRLADALFVAHMGEHEVLMVVAAPLLAVARPLATMLWAFPSAARLRLGGAARNPALRFVWRWLTDPLVATILHGVALWTWHAPALFNAALDSEAVHWLQHGSFFVTALFFWWALVHGRERERRYGAAIFYLFATALHSGFLGILLTFAPAPVYAGGSAAPLWGLTPLEDQQLAGLVMWVPAGLVYAVAALLLMAAWIRGSGLRAFVGERQATAS